MRSDTAPGEKETWEQTMASRRTLQARFASTPTASHGGVSQASDLGVPSALRNRTLRQSMFDGCLTVRSR